LAGIGSPDLDTLLPAGERGEAVDLARGMRRIVVYDDDGCLCAALFLTRSGVLPSRDWISGQLSEGEGSVGEWLAGRPSTPQPDIGPIVCVCHGIGEQQIVAAVDDGAADVAAVGSCTLAGTNCGSCRPVIARLLDEAGTSMQEAAQ